MISESLAKAHGLRAVGITILATERIVSRTREFKQRTLADLKLLYGDDASACLDRIVAVCERHRPESVRPAQSLWNERDVVLIIYGDQIRSDSTTPLAAFRSFVNDESLAGLFSTIHLLPFFPYSSDDGFSVIDYRQIDPKLGDWSDVAALNESSNLMFDLVLNHCSSKSRWFHDYLSGTPPLDRFFIEVDPDADLTAVTRPRSLPLLSPFETNQGTRHLWTTFSDDQIDLNFAEADVLVEMIDVLLSYVEHGARIIRLDAIAYLWKTIGTSCIHLPETHAVVRLMRDVLDAVAPNTILLTETNVPHEENVSYFGDGDEAHMVYNFSLAPLLLDAFLSQDAGLINAWLADLEPANPGTAYFNFTASHDGVGVRPLEGLVEPERFERLVSALRARGGHVSTKRNSDGSDSPYELNIAYFSALGPSDDDPGSVSPECHVRRFLSSQAVMLALRGIPGVYFHSLVGTGNDCDGVKATGRARSINRRKFHRDELNDRLHNPAAVEKQVFDGYRRLLATRIEQPAFHPDAAQSFVDAGHPAVIAFLRSSGDGQQRILALTNVASQSATLRISDCVDSPGCRDLLGGSNTEDGRLTLQPFATAWLELD
jgi:sucrose phosphorylase